MSELLSPEGFLPFISFVLLVAGILALFLGLALKQNQWIRFGGGFSVGGAVGLVISYFYENPHRLFELRNYIAIALIGFVIWVVKILSNR